MADFNQSKINEAIRDIAMAEIFHHKLADGSVDKEAWFTAVEGRLRAEQPGMVKWFARYGLSQIVDDQSNYALRHTKAVLEVHKTRSRQRVWGEIPSETEPGKFNAKHVKDWTVGDVRLWHDFHMGKVCGHRKVVDWAALIIKVAESLGMTDQDTVAGIIKIIAS